jgi:hypothetical protein
MGLNYASFMRWQDRMERKERVLKEPGPQKVEPLDLGRLFDDIRALSHGHKRTDGTGQLYEENQKMISRRALQRLVADVRREIARDERMMKRQVEWLQPGVVWSMDDTEYKMAGIKYYVHMVQDLASRYKFMPLTGGRLATGEQCAAHLEMLFLTYGAPLLLKRDNHGNLNSKEVNDVLARHMVIPLNSPTYYPPYNGGIERCQFEMQRQLDDIAPGLAPCDRLMEVASELAAHRLNHKCRRSLNDATACGRFDGRKRLLKKYDRRTRKEVFEEIKSMSVQLASKSGLETTSEIASAWRLAVETWLQQHGIITVHKPRKVLPH